MRVSIRPQWLLVVAVLMSICPLDAGAEASVGRLLAMEGSVAIDAFGKGAFIAARKGDLLYRESVLRIPSDGAASLELGQRSYEAPPGATLRVAELLGFAERRAGLRWIDALGRMVSSVVRSVRGSEEEVTLGSRAADESDTEDVFWSVEEDEDQELYRTGREKIAAGDPSGALRDLLAVEAESAEAYSPAELAFWRGHCYFELGDHGDAEPYLAAARQEAQADAFSLEPDLTRLLLLELGASQFYLGRPGDSVGSLRALVRNGKADERTLYGYVLLVEALSGSGDRTGAAAELRAAEKLFAGSASAADLGELRAKLSL